MKNKKLNNRNIKIWSSENTENVYRDCDCACEISHSPETTLISINDFSRVEKVNINKIKITERKYAVWNNADNGIKIFTNDALNWFNNINISSSNRDIIQLLKVSIKFYSN